MKKLLTVLLSLLMIVALAGCQSNGEQAKEDTQVEKEEKEKR